ncbi:hypothetical protein GTW69_13105, partial [Streptomyces sp. SID7760]|nr:hypothetical protein [Streptomyces sp. SID7760]
RAAAVADLPHGSRDGRSPGGPGDLLPETLTPPTEAAPPDAGLLYFATTAWLDSLTADLETIASGRVAARTPG